MPFAGSLGFLEKYAINLGGMTGSLGVDTIQHAFRNRATGFTVAPSICYESVYGEYMGEFVKKGAQLIFIITNDGWWRDTPGHRQHCSYARLRAIESRRSIARSANTGISCFVNQRGDISQATEYWKPAAIKQAINANSEITFYTEHGDYIARICSWLSLIGLIGAFVFKLIAFRNRKKAKA
jgi:apolipoprotein N-acyltransferase